MRLAIAALVLVAALAPPALAQGKPKKGEPVDVQKRLDTQKVTLNFDDTPLEEVIAFFQDITGLNFVLDPACRDMKVTLKVKDVTLKNALQLALGNGDATHEVWRGFVYVGSKSKPKKAPPAPNLPEGAKKVWETRKVALNFSDTPLPDVVAFLSDITGIKFEAAKAVEKTTVSIRVKDATLGAVVDAICRLAGLELTASGQKLVLDARK